MALLRNYAGLLLLLVCTGCWAQPATDTLVLRDLEWDAASPASLRELQIPSDGSRLQAFMYKANGSKKHPTLLLLHGFPGNERNLDLAQVVRAHGWNVVYFNYRGSWGSEGNFSFEHAVQDVVNVVAFCKKYQDSLQIDPANIVLFGHSMGGWVCLKALQQLPDVKKGFALSTWDIHGDFRQAHTLDTLLKIAASQGEYFVLNASSSTIFTPVFDHPTYYDLSGDGKALAGKQLIMLDEHSGNKPIADALAKEHKAYFDYQVWHTDHPFTNKRVALIKRVLAFLDK